MIRVDIAGVALDALGQHIILLKPRGSEGEPEHLLPIWVGDQEATSILIAVEGETPPRPLAHDLLKSLLEAVGAHVDRVEVTRLDDGTFFAEITVETHQGTRVLDSRPSDAIAVASRTGAPMWVADDVFAAAAIPGALIAQQTDEDDSALDDFHRFIDGVEPEDFQG